jgi:DNA-binding IclR family transcriptional regulator
MPVTASRSRRLGPVRSEASLPASQTASPLGQFIATLPRLTSKKKRRSPPAGIQSLEAGLRLLGALVAFGRAAKLTELALATEMTPPQAHRYLASFVRTGWAVPNEDGKGYRCGPAAMQFSVTCMNGLEPVKLASQALEALCADIDCTVAIAAWGTHGPTILRLEESSHPVTMNIRAGTSAPLLASASGLIFAAHGPRAVLEPAIRAALAQRRTTFRSRAHLEQTLEAIRREGLARVSGTMVPGVDAIAAPVFDHRGRVVLTILAVCPTGRHDLSVTGHVGKTLREYAVTLSARLGWTNGPVG